MSTTDTDVVVVGGGPVGMAVAAFLHRAGVAVRILDDRADRTGQTRAAIVHPRTLEVLDALPGDPADPAGPSLADRMVAAGRRLPSVHFAALPDQVSYRDLDTSFPFGLRITQPETERLLDEHLARAGAAVESGRRVTALEQDGERVTVTDADGRRVTARYAVGADGAHSVVRHALGIGFPGVPATNVSFLADVRLDRPPPPGHHWDTDRGWYTVSRQSDDVYRIFGAEPRDTGLTPEQARERQDRHLDENGLRAILDRTAGDDFGLRDVLWTSHAADATRHADRYRAGRVFLAGDAAHIHLPAGGQGMNVGIQDAANLAWKLAAEIAGRAPAAVVDGAWSYDAERRPIAARLASNTLAQSGLMTTFTPAVAALRELLSGLIARDGDTADHLRGWLSGLAVAYPPPGDGPLGAPAGQRVPNLPLADGRTLHRALPPDRVALVTFGTDAVPDVADERVCRLRTTRPWPGAAAALVRPDGYAAAVWAPDRLGDAASFAEVIGRWTARRLDAVPDRSA